ncbi:MAG: hypothetical protein FWB83_02265 [Treponema sp.]|nr:hypothetical protein [Treponema sp.]
MRRKLTVSKFIALTALLLTYAVTLIFTSCGIEEYYYLPQVYEGYIRGYDNTSADVTVPSISSEYYYALGYRIFYKIYYTALSNILDPLVDTTDPTSQTLRSDFNAFRNLTDPANQTTVTTSTTFSGRNFYELRLQDFDINNLLSKSGTTFTIQFTDSPGWPPVINTNGGDSYALQRSNVSGIVTRIFDFVPEDKNFINSSELNSSGTNINLDVSSRSDSQYAYALMYIVTVGQNPANFTPVYSKPTFINIFKLPASN